MTKPASEVAKEWTIDKILDAVYIHGIREGNNPGSRSNILALPGDELTIATALKMLNEAERAKLLGMEKVVEAAQEVNQLALEKKIIDVNKSGLQGLEILHEALNALTTEGK